MMNVFFQLQLKEDVNKTFYEMIKNYADYNFEENSTVPIDYMQSTVCFLIDSFVRLLIHSYMQLNLKIRWLISFDAPNIY